MKKHIIDAVRDGIGFVVLLAITWGLLIVVSVTVCPLR